MLAFLTIGFATNAATTNTITFDVTSLARNTGPVVANGAASFDGSVLAVGDAVVFDGFVVNPNSGTGDAWGAVALNAGGFRGVTTATLGVLVRTGSTNPSQLWTNGVSAGNFPSSSGSKTNRVRITLVATAANSTANMNWSVQIDQGLTGTFSTTLSGSGVDFTGAGNIISLSFGANNQSHQFAQYTTLPVILTQPQSVTILAGQNTQINAGIVSVAPVSYQWMAGAIGSGVYTNLSNGGEFSGVTTSTLSITNANMSDNLDLVVVATSANGSATSAPPATLTVMASAPPVFEVQPSPLSATVYPNASLTFRPTVSGSTPIAYFWQTNSVNVAGATNSNVSVSALGLVTDNTYTVTLFATNAFGTATSEPITLTVVSNPPAVAVIYEDSFTRTGALNGSAPDVTDFGGATWTAATALNTTGTNLLYTTAGGQAYLPFTPQWGHVYVLSVDLNGTSANNEWQAFGFAGTAQLNSGGFYNGATALLLARTSRSEAQALVNVNGNNIFGNVQGGLPVFNPGDNTFSIILDTTTGDTNSNSGWTVAFVENGAQLGTPVTFGTNPPTFYVGLGGNNNSAGFFDNFKLTDSQPLASHPAITVQPSPATVYSNSVATFTVSVTGSTPLFYNWKSVIGGVTNNVTGGTNASLVLSNVQPSQAGSYFVAVSNSAGFATSSTAALTVVPDPPQSYVLYHDSFGGTDPNLNGRSPEINALGGAWISDPRVTVATNALFVPGAQSTDLTAFLPFTPEWGHIYVLSVDLNPLSGTDWMDVGFSPSATTTASIPNQAGGPWFLQRINRTGSQMFSTGYTSPGSGSGGNSTGYTTWKIILDTTTGDPNANTGWTATFVVQGAPNSFGNNVLSIVYAANPTINYIAIGAQSGNQANGASGLADNVRLTDSISPLSIAKVGTDIVVSWPRGVLLEATTLPGTWTTNNAASPLTIVAPTGNKFFRVQFE